jgi:WD40 repeat protein
MQKSPFKFLDSYTKDDRDIFFGRDKEIEELYSCVFESKILVIYGISGTGKSSLINCGLANKFADSDWLPLNIRRGININKSLSDGLARAANGATGTNIVKVIKSIYLDNFKPVYLIFDQFEELFIFGGKDEKDEFVTSIKKIIDSDLQCRFIFSIREEYLAGITEFEKIIPSFLSNRIRIEKMTRQNALDVIEGPCRFNQIEVDPGFAPALLTKLNPDNPEVELTYLQVYLDKVFHIASSGGENPGKLTLDLLDKAGDVKDLLGSFLEEQIAKLEDPETGLVILKSFVSVKGTRQQITEDEIIEYSKTLGKDIDRAIVRSLIQKFIGLRILRDKDENGKYELRHDSLATRIYEKITLVEKELLEIKQFIENAWNNYEKRHLYLPAEDLEYIAPYEGRLFLSEKISKFIAQSKWEIHRAKRRRQNVLITAAVIIFAVLSAFTIWALKERSNAIVQKQFADTQKNSAIKAKEAADSASHEALISRNLALEKEKLAVTAQKQSEEARKEALVQRGFALDQKNRAEKLSVTANEQAQLANEEKLAAEQERSKAVTAEAKARQLGLLSTAQNLALKSSSVERNPALMSLVAVQAYVFNKENGGKSEDPIIWEALNNAWSKLDSSKHSVFTGSPAEIRALGEKNNGLLTADLDGQIKIWTPDGTGKIYRSFHFTSPVNLVSCDLAGEKIITQHDNLDLYLWTSKSFDNTDPFPEKLEGHRGLIRAVSFNKEANLMATGGSDSTIIIWNVRQPPSMKVNTIKTQSPVKAIVFINNDTIASALENGSIILSDIKKGLNTPVYNSSAGKPLCLAYNNIKGILFAGCSDGSLVSIDLNKHNSTAPVRYPVHTAGIDIITFNKDGSLLATSSWDKTIRFYNYDEYFGAGNTVGGTVHIKNLNQRVRSLIFTDDNKLVAGLSDKTIRLWETSSSKLSSTICDIVKRDMTMKEWNDMVGRDIPFEKTCGK